MSLIPEKKSLENQYRKIASLAVFLLGCICITWFVFHMINCGITGEEYDFLAVESLARLVLGFVLITVGYAMLKFIDWDYNRPRPQ